MAEASRGRSTGEPRERTLPWWVKLLVAFHVFAITVWSLPPPAPAIASGALTPSIDARGVSVFARSLIPYLHDRILLFAYRIKNPAASDSAPTRVVGQVTRGYLMPTGMWQYWDMFAPNPSTLDFWVDAEVVYRDGTRAVYAYPRMASLPIPMKYVQERFRKFLERAHSEGYQYAWPQFAQRIALTMHRDPSNPPVKVVLRRHFREIRPPDEDTPKEYSVYAYYEHTVDLGALRRDAGGR